LKVFPMKYHSDEPGLRERLLDRGRKYLELLEKPHCRDYHATYAVREINHPSGVKLQNFNAQGRVMVDHEGFYLHNPSSDMNTPYASGDNSLTYQSVPENQILICAAWINGYSFARKTWVQMSIPFLTEVEWNDVAFEKLVIDDNRRKLIYGLVKAHRHEKGGLDDIVQNKGRGLVGLLAGSPGVGKTLTAEAVAEVTRRPLYVVTAGELGTDSTRLDKTLDDILDITQRWGCVLLIDEADVFLSQRGGDLSRDTLVSIFLRRLEYFTGVALLTTNREYVIDDAFQSRIHFTIKYPELDEEKRALVWKNLLDGISRKNSVCNISEEDIARLAKRELNGRQIKNLVSCATSLARDNDEPITVEDVEGLLGVLSV